jgi:hypothetical protein
MNPEYQTLYPTGGGLCRYRTGHRFVIPGREEGMVVYLNHSNVEVVVVGVYIPREWNARVFWA